MIVIFVFWITFSIVWEFHYKLFKNNSYNTALLNNILPFRNFNHSESLEFWWTLVPSIILFFIALPALTLIYALETPFDAPALTFKIVGHQWYWSYQNHDTIDENLFPEHADKFFNFDSYIKVQSDLKFGHRRLLEVDRPLVIPVETPLRILVTSMDVIHSWAVPSLGIKIDAIPGKLNQFWLYAPYQGVFLGQCSELCGANHGFMPINVYVVTPENYLKWYFKISQDGREDQMKKLAQIIMSRKITSLNADPFIEQKEINTAEKSKKY
jgi:cytochrome c oxidase subunit II